MSNPHVKIVKQTLFKAYNWQLITLTEIIE